MTPNYRFPKICFSVYIAGFEHIVYLVLMFSETVSVISRTTCNECYAYIIQTYYHCKVCEDFDLCLDCYRIGKFPDWYLLLYILFSPFLLVLSKYLDFIMIVAIFETVNFQDLELSAFGYFLQKGHPKEFLLCVQLNHYVGEITCSRKNCILT